MIDLRTWEGWVIVAEEALEASEEWESIDKTIAQHWQGIADAITTITLLISAREE